MSDELVWQAVSPTHFRALADDRKGVYFVYVDSNWNNHHLIACFDSSLEPSFDSHTTILYRNPVHHFDEAKAAAQRHHDAACRSARWKAYMLDNEPPGT